MFHLLGSLIMGALVGWIAGKLMGADGGFLRNIIIGVVGSAVGQRGLRHAGLLRLRLVRQPRRGRGGRVPVHLGGPEIVPLNRRSTKKAFVFRRKPFSFTAFAIAQSVPRRVR